MVMLRMLAFQPAASSSSQGGAAPQTASASVPQSKTSYSSQSSSPKPAQTAPAQAVPVVNEPPVTIENGKLDWTALVDRLNLQGITGQLANHCLFESWDGKTLKLRLDPTAQSMHISSTEERLLKALKPVLGEAVRLDVIVGDAAPSQGETPAKFQARTKAERQQQAEQTFAEDPMTQALEQSFGARVVPNSVTPVDK
jgi:DNA polymerase-3 subunit gamma/tau